MSIKELNEFMHDHGFCNTNNEEDLPKKYVCDLVESALSEGRNKAIDEVMEVVKRAYHNFSGYDLEQMTKYGNKNARQQSESYSTLMMYEVAGEFEDLIDSLEQMKGGAVDG